VDEVGMMKRHLPRLQNDIDRVVHIDHVVDCGSSAQDVRLLRFFQMREGARVSSRQHTKTAVIDCAVSQRDPRGNEAWL